MFKIECNSLFILSGLSRSCQIYHYLYDMIFSLFCKKTSKVIVVERCENPIRYMRVLRWTMKHSSFKCMSGCFTRMTENLLFKFWRRFHEYDLYNIMISLKLHTFKIMVYLCPFLFFWNYLNKLPLSINQLKYRFCLYSIVQINWFRVK